jgi:hypothetical protein
LIADVDLDAYRAQLTDGLRKAMDLASIGHSRAVYWEFDVDNGWDSAFFLCRSYSPEAAADDGWADDLYRVAVWIRRIFVLALVVASVAACSRRELATTPALGDVSTGTEMTGQLLGDQVTGCIALRLTDGTEMALFWPKGYTAEFQPVRVFDGAGSLVASGSGPVYVGGDQLPSNDHPTCRDERFAFRVTAVTMTNPIDPR